MSDAAFGTTTAPALVVAFTGDEITVVRHTVAQQAADAGLTGDQLQDFVLAVNEIITNAVIHGGGQGELRLWDTGRFIGCEVVDSGPGGVLDAGAGPASEAGGYGLHLVRLLVDRLDVQESASGTVVRLMRGIPAHA